MADTYDHQMPPRKADHVYSGDARFPTGYSFDNLTLH